MFCADAGVTENGVESFLCHSLRRISPFIMHSNFVAYSTAVAQFVSLTIGTVLRPSGKSGLAIPKDLAGLAFAISSSSILSF